MRDRDSWLNATMIELADSGQAELDEAVYLGNFTDRLAELLGPVEVGLLLPGKETKAAGSGELALRLARLEADGQAGPCLTCCQTGGPMGSQRLTQARDRWPAYTAAALDAGLATCWALPLRRHAETIGAVSVLARSGYEIDSADFLLAQALTELATIGILRQRELRQSQRLAGQLQRALDSRIVIEQAKGAVSARLGITPGDAFELLRSYARSRSRPLAAVAEDALADTIPASTLAGNGRRPANNRPSGQGNPACRALCCHCAGSALPRRRSHRGTRPYATADRGDPEALGRAEGTKPGADPAGAAGPFSARARAARDGTRGGSDGQGPRGADPGRGGLPALGRRA